MQNFNRSFNEELIKEIPVISIGMFPGKFKPPHKGHFKTCKVAAQKNKVVYVLISAKEHEGITPDLSLEIWTIYKKYIPNMEPFIVSATPVVATYELLNILNNGGTFVPAKTTQTPVSNVEEVVQSSPILLSYLNKGNNFKANLYSSPEDAQRYRNAKKEPYMGNNVVSIDFKTVDRSTSATLFRQSLKTQNNFEIERFLPTELSREDKKAVINILRNANV
jgi:cytidyltransferase-like protein